MIQYIIYYKLKGEKMAYTNYESIADVAEEFNISFSKENFLEKKEFKINEYFIEIINRNFKSDINFMSEYAICESLIAPIIKEVAYANNLEVWSHIQFDCDENLKGIPDYLIGTPKNDITSIKTPVLCLGEAKRDDFIRGWGQVAAEMVAAQKINAKNKSNITVFGLVSNGKIWEFGKLENNSFTIDPNSYTAPNHIQELFDILNWFFAECHKRAC